MAASSTLVTVGDDEGPMEDDNCLIHESFKEFDEVCQLIRNLESIWQDQIAVERSSERFRVIIDEYQEQPHLLDPYLEELLTMLLNIGKQPDGPKVLTHQAFAYLFTITKMRGFKQVVRMLPHEVSDMAPLLSLLEAQDPKDADIWETRYMLLLWLSIVCMIPFDLKRLDSNLDQGDGTIKMKTMDRIMSIGKTYLCVVDKCSDASAYLTARFLTRPDVIQELLAPTLDWMMQAIKTADYSTMLGRSQLSGVLRCLGLLFKYNKRENMLEYAPIVLRVVMDAHLENCDSSVIRKMVVKLVQRIGLIFLKQKIASWRYQRGSRSLAANLGGSVTTAMQEAGGGENQEMEEEEDEDIPEEIEEVIEHMLVHLKFRDTLVRWAAAKGVGRVTGRLPRELADDVVGSVLELFNYQESDGAWHGGCLALAELARRGLLLPDRLKDVVPVIMKALAYDERRGNFSVGAHVRDAACYVCWAFARAYEPEEMMPYVEQIATSLIIVSVFDREVNVRRAAAAAFQENVGRQGTFPHGIDILTTVDYFAVGSRPKCYLELSVYMASFDEYTHGVIDHLHTVKIGHWDSVIRELTAKSLHNLTPQAPDYLINSALPKLLPLATGFDLFQRHGAILAIAEIVHALYPIAKEKNIELTHLLGENIIEEIKAIAKKLQDAKMFKRHGGEYMRTAVCVLIEKCSLCKLPFHKEPVIELWQSVIAECLTHIEPEIQAAAVSAIPAFFTEYFTSPDGTVLPEDQDAILSSLIKELSSQLEPTRQGHSLALGAMPAVILKGQLDVVLTNLISVTKITPKDEKMAEARRDAVKAIARICDTMGVKRDGKPAYFVCEENVNVIYHALLEAMKDCTLDSRGDIGALVREAAMQALHDVTSLIVKSDVTLLKPDIVKKVFNAIAQQSVEKIDRIRSLAAQLFRKLLYHEPPLPYIPQEDQVKKLFPEDLVIDTNWSNEAELYKLFSSLMAVSEYTYSVLLGLIVSVGGLTESLVKFSSASLLDYLKALSSDSLKSFMEVFITVFKDHQRQDRVSLPAMRTLDHMLSWGILDCLESDSSESIPNQLVDLIKAEMAQCGKPQKIMASADVYCALLQFGGTPRAKCLLQLMILLCHKYPRVRKTTSGKLYEALLTYDDIASEEDTQEIMNILSDTSWDTEAIDAVRAKRNEICKFLGIKPPVPVKKS